MDDDAPVAEFEGAALGKKVVDDVALRVAAGAADVDAERLIGFSGGGADGDVDRARHFGTGRIQRRIHGERDVPGGGVTGGSQ